MPTVLLPCLVLLGPAFCTSDTSIEAISIIRSQPNPGNTSPHVYRRKKGAAAVKFASRKPDSVNLTESEQRRPQPFIQPAADLSSTVPSVTIVIDNAGYRQKGLCVAKTICLDIPVTDLIFAISGASVIVVRCRLHRGAKAGETKICVSRCSGPGVLTPDHCHFGAWFRILWLHQPKRKDRIERMYISTIKRPADQSAVIFDAVKAIL